MNTEKIEFNIPKMALQGLQKPIIWIIKEDYISLHMESQGEFPPTSDLTLV